MSGPRLAAGEILPLVRRFSGTPDPLALHAALTDDARRPDTLLLETADAPTGVEERSIVVARSMLRLTCRGRTVEVKALSPNGAALAPSIPCSFPDISRDTLDERARLLAPGPLDALRAAVLAPRLVTEPGAFCFFAAGIFSHDLVDVFEELPAARLDDADFPDYVFWVPDRAEVDGIEPAEFVNG